MSEAGAIDFPTEGFEAIIFDLDGTLVDSMPLHFKAWCLALEKYGAPGIFPEDVFYAMGGRPTKDIVVDLNGEHGLHLDPVAVAYSKREAFLANLHEVEVIDEVVAFAREWYGKVPLAVATGGTQLVAEKTILDADLSSLFDEVVTADDVSCGKPAPDIYLETARRLGVAPEKCLVLEDAPAGIMAAQSAGMEVVVVPATMQLH